VSKRVEPPRSTQIQTAPTMNTSEKNPNSLTVKASRSVQRLLGTLCDVAGFHIAEFWINSESHFCLSATYVDEDALTPFLDEVMTFQHGNEESKTSRSLCKRALLSKHSFYWLSRKNEKVHPIVPYHTAISFHLPRDNINSDVYVCAYSLDYLKFSQVRGWWWWRRVHALLCPAHPCVRGDFAAPCVLLHMPLTCVPFAVAVDGSPSWISCAGCRTQRAWRRFPRPYTGRLRPCPAGNPSSKGLPTAPPAAVATTVPRAAGTTTIGRTWVPSCSSRR